MRAFLPGEARIDSTEVEREERVEEDPLGNPGTTCIETVHAVASTVTPGEELAGFYRRDEYSELPPDSHQEDDQVRFQRILTDEANPFLLEHVVQVGIRWRDLLPGHRTALERKVEELRKRLARKRGSKKKRAKAEEMLEDLESGILTRVHVESTRRLFRMDPVFENGGTMGSIVPLKSMDQLVYLVEPLEDLAPEDDEPARPMYITILAADDFRVSFLFSGGILGQRTVTNLDEGVAHNAWFRNRQNVFTDDTAPWVSRRVYRALEEAGSAEMVVRWGREDAPIGVRRLREETSAIRTPGGEVEVPVLVAETEKEDVLWILRDEASPLVLRMEEAGAELLRTVSEVQRLEDV